LDVRVAIGVGPVDLSGVNALGEAMGTALVRSGRALDGMSRRQRLAADTGDPASNAEFAVQLVLMDEVIQRWSDKDARAVAYRLQGATQADSAASEEVSQSAIAQRLSRAGWSSLHTAVERWAEVFADVG